MSPPLPEPITPAASRAELFLSYLDHFRAVVVDKASGLPDAQLRSSVLPSGWSLLELVRHLRHVEQRWLVWGFEGRPVDAPWGDAQDGRWHVPDDVEPADELRALTAQGEVTRAVVRAHALDDVGQPGERWDGGEPATLERVLFHLLQEHARHAGHVDVVRELLDGTVGE